MTAKKKRKKLIKCIYRGVPRDRVVHPSELTAQIVAPPWAKHPSIVFDAGPGAIGEDPPDGAGEFLSTISSTTETVQSAGGDDDSNFWVSEERLDSLSETFVRFVELLFGERHLGKGDGIGDEMKCLNFTSKVGSIAQERDIVWHLIQYKHDILYVLIDSAAFPEGSRASFVQLLDYAEEELECKNVVICFPGEHGKRGTILKTFMFLGFVPMRPGHKLIPPGEVKTSNKFMFMGYVIG